MSDCEGKEGRVKDPDRDRHHRDPERHHRDRQHLEQSRHQDPERHHRDRQHREQSRHHRDRDRDRDPDQDCDLDRERDRERDLDRDLDSDKETRPVPDRSDGPKRHRGQDRSNRGFDKALPQIAMIPGVAIEDELTNMITIPPGQLPLMPQSQTQLATQHARRVYVGGLPPTANKQAVADFFNLSMKAIGGNTAGSGDVVINVCINDEKKFGFVEMRTIEEASNAIALDGIRFEGAQITVCRPVGYDANLAATLGPSQPGAYLNLAAVGLAPDYGAGFEEPDRIFVGGLQDNTTNLVRHLLENFGPLSYFELVKDGGTGGSKVHAFCAYTDPSQTDTACSLLNGLEVEKKTLVVRRAYQKTTKQRKEDLLLAHQQQVALQSMMNQAILTLPTKVVCLNRVVSTEELKENKDYEAIMKDMRTKGQKYGKLVNVVIPRPGPNGEGTPGLGNVYLEYADTDGSTKAWQGLRGAKFDANGFKFAAVFFPENKFAQGEYDG